MLKNSIEIAWLRKFSLSNVTNVILLRESCEENDLLIIKKVRNQYFDVLNYAYDHTGFRIVLM